MKWTLQRSTLCVAASIAKLEELGVTEAKSPVRLLRSFLADRVGNNAP